MYGNFQYEKIEFLFYLLGWGCIIFLVFLNIFFRIYALIVPLL